MKNKRIRKVMFDLELKQFELADCLGIFESNASRLLNRKELPKKKQDEIIAKLKAYKKGGADSV